MTMTAEEVLAALESMGTAQNRKVYGRHGVGREMFGVSYSNLGKLKKKIRIDQEVAETLWASGNHDAMVLAAMVALGFVLRAFGGETGGLEEPAELIVWMASLPVVLRLAISIGAGVFEELFFRGFLQPRVGIGLSTLLFVLGHLSYGQPVMLFGIAILSLLYALLVRFSGNIWPAIVAHALFDAIQLLVVIPGALEAMRRSGGLS